MFASSCDHCVSCSGTHCSLKVAAQDRCVPCSRVQRLLSCTVHHFSRFVSASCPDARWAPRVQVAFSDRIILNKTDLVTKEELAIVKETINSINSFAELMESQQSRVPMDKLMGLNSFSLERFEEEIKEYDLEEAEECTDANCTDEACTTHGHEHGHHEHGHAEHGHECAEGCKDASHGHAEHGHAEHGHTEHEHSDHGHADKKPKKKKKHDLSGVGSMALKSEVPLRSADFNRFMTKLLQAKAQDLYRSKGVLCFEQEGNKKFVFQARFPAYRVALVTASGTCKVRAHTRSNCKLGTSL
eukprot:6204736-Pleurochrysis_carterae.AAC.3